MRNGYTKGLVSYGGNLRIFRPQGDPLSSRVSDCLTTPLALASSSKSKGAARRIVKDKGSGLIKPTETHRKELISAKNWKILMRRNSDRAACVATRQRPWLFPRKKSNQRRTGSFLCATWLEIFFAGRPEKMRVLFRVLREAVRIFL